MITFYDKLFGHPQQIQPSHMVITSPWFDTGEVVLASNTDGRRGLVRYETAPLDDIIELRDNGMSYDRIALLLGLAHASVHKWYARAKNEQKVY